ncbi:hypothetical protein D039_2648B, partial [Vibrio parahaemolyticus EKP-028]
PIFAIWPPDFVICSILSAMHSPSSNGLNLVSLVIRLNHRAG